MKLLSLEIDGFKSFANKTVFDLNKNITAIVGPNGSGKSNIVDAIRWLLGEQSSKQIRISERTDVIFAGSNTYRASRKAYVKLYIEIKENEQISIMKLVDRDTGNKYFINDNICSLKDIHNLFSDSAISNEFYSIVSQGQVSDIVNASSENLRDIVLSAAKIGNYIEKKKKSLKLLEDTSENLDRINDYIFQIDKRLKSLSIKAGRAKKHLEYTSEMKDLGKNYFGAKKYQLLNLLEKNKIKEEELLKEKKENLSNLFEVERIYRDIKSEIDDVEKELSKKTDLIENYRNRLEILEKEKTRINQQANDINSKIISIDLNIKNSYDKKEKFNLRLEEINSLVDKFKEDVNKFNLVITKLEKEKLIIEEKIDEEDRILSKLESEIESLNKENKKLNNLILENDKNISGKIERKNFLSEEKDRLSKDIYDLELKIIEYEKIISQHNEEKTNLKLNIDEKLEILQQLREKYEKNKNYLENLSKEKNNLEHHLENLNNQINDYSGFSYVIKLFFNEFRNKENVIDVVANLISADQQYEEAITAISGYKLQNIVVKNSSEVEEYLEYIKNKEAGKITFLPLDLLKTKNILHKNVLNESGVIDYLINLIDFDKKFINVMEYVFSNTLLVDNLKSAIYISKNNFRGNIVTFKGEVISGSGTISGGKNKNDYSNTILKRKREVEEVKLRLIEINENFKHYNDEMNKLNIKINKEKEIYNNLKEEYNDLIIKKNMHDSNYKTINSSFKEKKENFYKIETRITNYNEEIENLSNIINETKESINKNENEIIKKDKQKSTLISKSDDFKKDLNNLNSKILENNLELKSVKEKYDYYSNEKRTLFKSLEEVEYQIEKNEEDFKNYKKKRENINNSLEETKEEFSTLNEEITKIFDVLKETRTGKIEKLDRYEQLEKERNDLKEKNSNIKDKIQKLELDYQKTEHNLKFIVEKAKNNNIEEEEFVLKNLTDDEIFIHETRLKDLEDSLRKLGSVDLTVLDEYDEVKNEYNETMEEKEDVDNSINILKEAIKELDQQAEEKYVEFFEALNKEFQEFIVLMFRNGYGELRLIGEGLSFEKGIQISVKKTGRNFQKLQLFSGGEKALIAIAFLFSMMNLNPSPFYILDEIDAPLDDLNSTKISSLIEKNSKISQFLMITHNKLVMEIAEIFYGITMKDGVTHVVPVNFKEMQI